MPEYNPEQCAYCKSLNTRWEISSKAPMRQHCLDCDSVMDGDLWTFFDTDEPLEIQLYSRTGAPVRIISS